MSTRQLSRSGACGVGVGVPGLRFRVKGVDFGVYDMGCGVWGVRFRVSGLGCGVSGFRLQVSGFRHRIWCWVCGGWSVGFIGKECGV